MIREGEPPEAAGDDIEVGDVSHSRAVAVGRGAVAVETLNVFTGESRTRERRLDRRYRLALLRAVQA